MKLCFFLFFLLKKNHTYLFLEKYKKYSFYCFFVRIFILNLLKNISTNVSSFSFYIEFFSYFFILRSRNKNLKVKLPRVAHEKFVRKIWIKRIFPLFCWFAFVASKMRTNSLPFKICVRFSNVNSRQSAIQNEVVVIFFYCGECGMKNYRRTSVFNMAIYFAEHDN